jgi:hypothetical protein
LSSTADGTLYFNVVDLENWDRALFSTTLLSKKSLKTMGTPFVLNDGKPNPSHYGSGWIIEDVNGHRMIHHAGAWQGFTCTINRFVDDKLTVVVLTNLDAAHSSPDNIARVVAGLVEPALMPKTNPAIEDAKPDIAARASDVLQHMLAGKNVADAFSVDAGYEFNPNDAADMRSQLPEKWRTSPLTLIKRTEHDGAVRSVYRIGPPGNTRMILVQLDAKGKIANLAVKADPDNR